MLLPCRADSRVTIGLRASMAYDSCSYVWPMYEAIKCETSRKPSIREKNLLSSWALDISVKMVYYHQLSIIYMRVWRCFIRIVRSYFKYFILALSMLFCYGICYSIIYIIYSIIHIFREGKIHCLICVNIYSLNCIHFMLWSLIDSYE